jgi:uncharacterized protein (TIGR02001 family)
MRNYCKTIGALAAASALAAGTASAQLEYEIHTGYTNEYLFRGLNLGQDLVEAGVDVSSEWNGLGVSAGAWYGSWDDANELDLYGSVSKNLGFATAAVGYIFYHYPQDFIANDAQEVYASLSREFFGFNTSLTYFWDIEGDNDGYAELALQKSFPLSQCLSLNVGTALGYYVEHSDFAHLTTKVALDWAFRENAILSPFIAGSLSLSDTAGSARQSLNAGAKNQFVGGVKLSVGF